MFSTTRSQRSPLPLFFVVLPLSQHDTEVLSRETELLKGWERLYPPENLPTGVGGASTKTSRGKNVGQENRRKLDATPPQAPAPTQAADGGGNADRSSSGSPDVGHGGGGGGGLKDGRRRRKSASVETMIQ